jgi:hypothetical protein
MFLDLKFSTESKKLKRNMNGDFTVAKAEFRNLVLSK